MAGVFSKKDANRLLTVMQDRALPGPEFIPISGYAIRELMKMTRPHLFALYDAGWRSGFKVNGVEPNG